MGARLPSDSHIALLRGINVGGRNRVPMADLRSLCSELGWEEVRSYIQSGNLVFRASHAPADLEEALERGIERRFGLTIPVIVRQGEDWHAYIDGNPFPEESADEPNRVLLSLAKAPPSADAVDELLKLAAGGERLARVGDAIWVYYRSGVGKSKLTPARFDRLVGSSVTARNWRTVLALRDLLQGSS